MIWENVSQSAKLGPVSRKEARNMSRAEPVRVGLNARYLNSPMSGIERYMAELLRNADPAECEFHPREVRSRLWRRDQAHPLVRKIRPFYYAFWDRYMESLEGAQQGIDIFHAPSFIAPRLSEVPVIITVHDLAFRIHPEFFDLRTRGYFRFFLESSLAQAARIICVSQATASDLSHFYPKHQDKVRVVYNGFTDFSLITPDDRILTELGLSVDDEYLLCVGALNPRKNVQTVLALVPRLREKRPNLKIVVVGRLPTGLRRPFDPCIIFTGYLTDEALSSLYRHAALFVYPSKYEGFGFPILEAMSVGTPVAYSSTSSLPEVAGLGETHAFDPDDPESVLATVSALLDRGRTGIDSARVAASLARFSWHDMSTQTVEIYKECLR